MDALFSFDGMSVTTELIRWIHVVAGVLWIGHLYFFNWVNANFAATMDAETKKKVVPELMPRALHFFRWGAAFTWLTGILLLGLVFYMGKAVLEKDVAWGAFQLAMLAVTFLGVFLYDVLVKSVLKTGPVQFWGGLALVAGALFAYRAADYSFRGYSIHLGALFGTIMAFNVWFRIWPAQKTIITAVKNGQKPEDATVALAGTRSRHNTFLSVPLLFFMLNSHATWASSGHDPFPVWPLVVVAVGWVGTHHLYAHAKKVKGF
jgi:uncharacterized membrane protein